MLHVQFAEQRQGLFQKPPSVVGPLDVHADVGDVLVEQGQSIAAMPVRIGGHYLFRQLAAPFVQLQGPVLLAAEHVQASGAVVEENEIVLVQNIGWPRRHERFEEVLGGVAGANRVGILADLHLHAQASAR